MLEWLSKLGFLVMVAGLAGLAVTHSLFSPGPVVIGVQVAAALLLLWARVTFGRRSFHATASATPGGLVTTGPYRYIRHPIYTAVCLFAAAGALAHPSRAAAFFALLIAAGALVRMLAEERSVVVAYPDYVEYARRTKRMVPYVF